MGYPREDQDKIMTTQSGRVVFKPDRLTVKHIIVTVTHLKCKNAKIVEWKC